MRVLYTFDGNITPSQANQIITALTQLNNLNTTNGSHVQYINVPSNTTWHLKFQNDFSVLSSSCGSVAEVVGTPSLNPYAVIVTFKVGGWCFTSSGSWKYIDPAAYPSAYDTIYTKLTLHEIGHTEGLLDVGASLWSSGETGDCARQAFGSSVMNAFVCIDNNTNDNAGQQRSTMSTCDKTSVTNAYAPSSPGTCGNTPFLIDPDFPIGDQCGGSPLVIDLTGNGFDFTDANAGVFFDLVPDGYVERVGWTSANSGDAWLALDRNGNGSIDDGSELFGDHTIQPQSSSPNGFLALAQFDEASAGGNGDGQIGGDDEVYSRLRLWLDENHNGISEPNELLTLDSAGIQAIGLDYQQSARRDEHGNAFRYRAVVKSARESHVGHFAYDVYLVKGL